MAGDLDRFAVDGGIEQFLEYLKTKMGIRRPQEEVMAFKKYVCEIKSARVGSMTRWINRSDEEVRIPQNQVSHGKNSGNLRKRHACEAVEEIPEDDDDTYLDDDFSENDDP